MQNNLPIALKKNIYSTFANQGSSSRHKRGLDNRTQFRKLKRSQNDNFVQNISTQTNFKSSSSTDLDGPKYKVEIFKETCTQTSRTVINLSEYGSPRYSPDSLSPKEHEDKRFIHGDSLLDEESLLELDYISFNKQCELSAEYCKDCAENQEILAGNSLTKVFLAKNRYRLGAASQQVYPSNNNHYQQTQIFKSQSFVEQPVYLSEKKRTRTSRYKGTIPSQQRHHHQQHDLADQFEQEIEGGNDQQSVCSDKEEYNKKTVSFMSPTIASESKDQSIEIERIKTLIGPTRRGRSASPKKFLEKKDASPQKQNQVPYIDTANASRKKPEIQLDLKGSCDQITCGTSALDTGTSCNSTDAALGQSILKLKDLDWNVALRGLAEIVEISRILDIEVVYPHMTIINQRLIELIKSPRSHVCRTACQAAGHLFEFVKDTRRPEFDEIVDTLLTKTADSNKFIRHDANLALDCMVTHIPTFHSVRALCNKGPEHKNPLARTAAARLLVCAVVIGGPQHILNPTNNEYTRKRVILNMVKFMEDRCQEIRKFGERIYKLLCKDRIFEIYLKRYLEPDIVKKIKQCLQNINGQKM